MLVIMACSVIVSQIVRIFVVYLVLLNVCILNLGVCLCKVSLSSGCNDL